MSSLNDAALVRLDLAASARELGLRCVARALVSLDVDRPEALWNDVAADFERHHDTGRLARSCARAAHAMRTGDVDGAVRVLATFCGLSPDAWLGPTLISCAVGISRSASVAYALLRVLEGLSHEDAYERVFYEWWPRLSGGPLTSARAWAEGRR